MSSETVRARLDAARQRPWRVDSAGCCVVSDNDEGRAIAEMTWENAPLIAHAPEDLEAALKVIKAVKEAIDSVFGLHVLEFGEDEIGILREEVDALRLAFSEFEALP